MDRARWESSPGYIPGMTPQEAYEQTKKWDFPFSQWETDLVKEIDAMKRVPVAKADAANMQIMGMVPQQCHVNVAWYVKNDPAKSAKMVTGWLLLDNHYLLHSVIKLQGRLICITPTPYAPTLEFRPDKKITVLSGKTRNHFIRNGQEVGVGIRRNPEATRRMLHPALRDLRENFGCRDEGENDNLFPAIATTP